VQGIAIFSGVGHTKKMPDYCISSIEPLLLYLAGESAIETNLTDEEKMWVWEGRQQYRERPEDFVPLESIH
jgi:hypothetical protein